MESNPRPHAKMPVVSRRVRNPARTSVTFEELLPAGIAAAELAGEGDAKLLLPAERKHLGAAVAKRVGEFAAGRLCARRALSQFGITDFAVEVAEDRRPRWPDAVVGSITHTTGFSAAAVGERSQFSGIGIDAERVGSVTRELWDQVLLPDERRWLETLNAVEQGQLATLIFSAKEAFYKCQFELTGQWLEFSDVTLDLAGWNMGAGSFSVRALGRVKLFERHHSPVMGRFAFRKGLVLTAIAIPAV
jgi:4'-phosphopantetheinyl transferase EntD